MGNGDFGAPGDGLPCSIPSSARRGAAWRASELIPAGMAAVDGLRGGEKSGALGAGGKERDGGLPRGAPGTRTPYLASSLKLSSSPARRPAFVRWELGSNDAARALLQLLSSLTAFRRIRRIAPRRVAVSSAVTLLSSDAPSVLSRCSLRSQQPTQAPPARKHPSTNSQWPTGVPPQ